MRVDFPKLGKRSAEKKGGFQEKEEQTRYLHTLFLQVWYESFLLDQNFGDVFKMQISQSNIRPTESVTQGCINYVLKENCTSSTYSTSLQIISPQAFIACAILQLFKWQITDRHKICHCLVLIDFPSSCSKKISFASICNSVSLLNINLYFLTFFLGSTYSIC